MDINKIKQSIVENNQIDRGFVDINQLVINMDSMVDKKIIKSYSAKIENGVLDIQVEVFKSPQYIETKIQISNTSGPADDI